MEGYVVQSGGIKEFVLISKNNNKRIDRTIVDQIFTLRFEMWTMKEETNR